MARQVKKIVAAPTARSWCVVLADPESREQGKVLKWFATMEDAWAWMQENTETFLRVEQREKEN